MCLNAGSHQPGFEEHFLISKSESPTNDEGINSSGVGSATIFTLLAGFDDDAPSFRGTV